jgi:hypothetical protein
LKIVFLHVDAQGEYSRWGNSLARMMIQSCKRVMPEIEVVQLTDDSQRVPGSDSVTRLDADDEFLMPFKLKHLSQIGTPFIFLDTDMLVTESLASVFDSPFDVAMYWRDKVIKTKERLLHMPYNAGFIACNNNDFFKDCHDKCKTYSEDYRQWFGDQIAIFETAKEGKYKLLDLPETWNHPPESLHDLNAKVLHYKGEKRKAWMPQAFNLLKTATMV